VFHVLAVIPVKTMMIRSKTSCHILPYLPQPSNKSWPELLVHSRASESSGSVQCSKMTQPGLSSRWVHKDILADKKSPTWFQVFRFPLLLNNLPPWVSWPSKLAIWRTLPLPQTLPLEGPIILRAQTQLHLQACQTQKPTNLWVFTKGIFAQGLNWGDPFFPSQKIGRAINRLKSSILKTTIWNSKTTHFFIHWIWSLGFCITQVTSSW